MEWRISSPLVWEFGPPSLGTMEMVEKITRPAITSVPSAGTKRGTLFSFLVAMFSYAAIAVIFRVGDASSVRRVMSASIRILLDHLKLSIGQIGNRMLETGALTIHFR